MQFALKVILFFIIIAYGQHGFGQNISKEDREKIDSLKQLDYEEIYNSFLKNESDSTIAFVYAQAYLEKGKNEKDNLRIANAYTQFSAITRDIKVALEYVDSIEVFSKNIINTIYPALIYYHKAILYYEQGDYQKALDNALLTIKYANLNKNEDYLFGMKQLIISLKSEAGDSNAVIILNKEILSYISKSEKFKSKLWFEYMNTLNNLSIEYISLKEIDSANLYIRRGIKDSKEQNDENNYLNFVSLSGKALYLNKDYDRAFDSIKKGLKVASDRNLAIDHYYIGKIYLHKNDLEEGIKNLKKTDSIFQISRDPFEELIDTYKIIIDYYKEKDDTENQLKYIDKFIAADSVLDANYNYLNTNITKEYDIPLLVSEKENLISRLKNEKRTTNLGLGISIGVGLLLAGGFFYYYRKQRFYKKRFEEILNTKPSSKSQISSSKSLEGISKEVIDQIQKGLDHFESQKEFLDSSITLNSLSKTLNTNSNYLSKVINFNKQKNFSNYLNDLRIEYAIEQLKNNPQFRKYSVKGMAQEAGFNSPESFSKAFYKRSGLYPSYFLKQLEKTI